MNRQDALPPDVGPRASKPLAAVPLPERLEILRGQIARVPSRVGTATRIETPGHDVLRAPGALGSLLPGGGLAPGTITTCSRGSVLVSLLAAATSSGEYAAVVGYRGLGLLAATEMGADLSRLAHIPDPGADPLQVVSVLLDGIRLVVLDTTGIAIPPDRARALGARVRNQQSSLLVVGGWTGADLKLESAPTGYGGLGRGCGRVRAIHVAIRTAHRSGQAHAGRLSLSKDARTGRVTWTSTSPVSHWIADTG